MTTPSPSATNIVAYAGPDTIVNGTAQIDVLAGANPLQGGNPLQPGLLTSAVTTIDSVIVGSATSLTVGGTGTLTIPTANTYAGTTYLEGGTLIVGSNTSLGTGTLTLASGTLQASAAVTLANPFTLNDSSVTIAGINDITLTGTGTLSDTAAGTANTPSGGTNTLTVSNAGLTTISGKLQDGATSGSLTVAGGTQIANPMAGVAAGTGNVVLGGTVASTYTGGTVLANGSLILASGSALGTGTLTLTSGTLMSDASLRTLANSIVLNGNVTLAASAADGTASTSSGLTFNGPVALTGNNTLTVNDSVIFNGIVSGTGQLTVAGLGSLTLANSGNTFSGGTVLNAGSLGATGTLIVNNSNGTTAGSLSSGSLGTGPLTLVNGTVQGTSGGVTIANQLMLGGGYVTFAGANYIDFSQTSLTAGAPVDSVVGTANLIANVTNTASPANTTTINDQLTGNGNLTLFSGTGTLALTAADSYGGGTTINGGTLSLSGASGQLSEFSTTTINVGGVLTVDDTGTLLANRLGDGDLQMNGGTLNILGGSSGAQEALGQISLLGGNSTIRLTTPASTAALAVGGLARNVQGATVDFLAGSGQKFGVADQVTFGGLPQLTGNILPYATVTDATTSVTIGGVSTPNSGGYNLATINGSNELVALTSYQALSTTGANSSTDNVLVTSTPAAILTDTVNAVLVIGDGVNVKGATGATLNVVSGLVASNDTVTSNPAGNAISVPTLAFGSAEGIILANADTVTINSTITGIGGLTLGGAGNVVLATANSYTGGVSNQQTITLDGPPSSAAATAGTFTLSFNGSTTSGLGFAPTAASLQTALTELPSIGANNVSVTGGFSGFDPNELVFTVTFQNLLAGSIEPALTVASNTLVNGQTGSGAPTVVIGTASVGQPATAYDGGTIFNGTSFSQAGELTLETNNAVLGGLTIDGGTLQASTAITLPNAVVFGTNGGGSSSVTLGSAIPGFGSPIVFSGGAFLVGLSATVAVANPTSVPMLLSGIVSSLPGANGGAASTTALIKQGPGTLELAGLNTYTGETVVQQGILNVQNGAGLGATGNAVQVITFGGSITGGTFTLTYNGATTGPITWSSNGTMLAYNIQFALNALSTVGLTNAAVTGTGPFTIAFQNLLGADSNVAALSASASGLDPAGIPTGGTSPALTPAFTTPGTSSGTVVAGGATLQLQSGSVGITIPEAITISGSGVGGLGAVQNLIGTNTLSGSVTLAAGATVGGNVGGIIINGIITGAADLTKIGTSTLQLGGNNNYNGYTNLNAGIVQLNNPTGLGSNAGGVTVASGTSLQLGIGAGTGLTTGAITSIVGTVAGKALTISGVGLGLFNSTLVTANGALMANSITPVTWTGNITLSGNTTINTAVTTADTTAGNVNAVLTLSGNISGTGTLTKVGSSILYLTGTDTYSGPTIVQVGTLDIGGAGSWQPGTVPGTNAVQTITFGGTITTGSTFTLSFNDATTAAIAYSTATATLQSNIQNALNALATIGLSGNTNTLVSAASATSVTITFQHQLGNTNLPQLTLNSSLTGTSPTASVASTVTGVAAVDVLVGATFTLDDTNVNLPNRLSSSATIALNGGTLAYLGNSLNAVSSTQTVGVISLGSGANTLSVTAGSGISSAAILTSAGLLRDVGATVNFVGATAPLGGATTQIQFTSAISAAANGPFANLTNSVLPWATVQGPNSTSLNFATYALPGGVAALTNYVTDLATATSTQNVILTTATTLSANVTVNSLLLLGTLTLTAASGGNNFTLTVASGGLVASSGGTATLAGGTLNFGTSEGILTASTALTINSSITGTGGLTVSGAGTVTLNGTGVYTGTTTYNGAGINTGNFAIGTVSALGNTTLDATAGVVGTSFGGAFSTFSNPIVLNNSVVGFGLTGTQPTIAGPITLIGSDFIEASNNTAQISGSIGGSGNLTIGPNGTKEALVLEGFNTYTGGTNLDPAGGSNSNDNELDVTSSNAFGTGPINWLGGQIDTLRVVVGSAVESATGSITIPNTINLVNSDPEFAGPWYEADGLGYVTLSGTINVTGTCIINTLISVNLTISGVIQGTGNLTLGTQMYSSVGPAVGYVPAIVTLTNANTISGGMGLQLAQQADTVTLSEVTGGQLVVENTAALGTGIFTLGDGTLQDDGVHQLTITNNIQIDAASFGGTVDTN